MKGVCALYDLLSKEVEDSMLWPTPEEMKQLVGELDYLIPKNEDGSLKYKDLDQVCITHVHDCLLTK